MRKSDYFDDHTLGAFVDGQLDTAHCESIIKAMDNDPEVRERVYRLRRAKDLMKLGFGDACAPSSDQRTVRTPIWKQSALRVAASIAVLLVSFGVGTLGYHYGKQMDRDSTPVLASATGQQADRIILHISESDPRQFAAALAYTQEFLNEHEARGNEIDVVANADGLDFMRVGVSPYEDQVIAMMRERDNVHFIACAYGIRLLHEQGIAPDIIEGIGTDKTAMDHIIGRLQSGWTYIKVDLLLGI